MRPAVIGLVLLSLSGCWADFPKELLEPDGPGATDQSTTEQTATLDLVDGQRVDGDGPTPGVLNGQGAACTVDDGCLTGRCVDGVCCNAACAGLCMSCDQAGSVGQCRPVPAGTDPDAECAQEPAKGCGQDGMCDGRGGCRQWPGGTVCSPAKCGGADGDRVDLARVCDGNGTCLDFGNVHCDPYACNPATIRCYESCTSNSQCKPGDWCQNGRCDYQDRPDGAACQSDGDCDHNHCADGVCCDTSCTGTCDTCKLTVGAVTLAGKCIPIPAGLDPDNECGSAPPCGYDGTCDGAGACRDTPAGTICKTPVCSAGQLEPFHRCDGAGLCQPDGAATPCGAYDCATATSCYGRCTSDAHCGPSASCNLTTHQCQ